MDTRKIMLIHKADLKFSISWSPSKRYLLTTSYEQLNWDHQNWILCYQKLNLLTWIQILLKKLSLKTKKTIPMEEVGWSRKKNKKTKHFPFFS